MSQILIKNIIRQLNEIHDGALWFDECFRNKIDKLTDDEALTRPIPQIHSVAELVSHCLAWRKECMLRFKDLRTELMNSPDDWKNNIELSKAGWTELKNSFYESRTELIHLIENQDDTFLEKINPVSDCTYHYLIEGIIHHDLYHLGQIGITIKLLNENKKLRT
jgi:uncharacterized damage-inducible protein DinB